MFPKRETKPPLKEKNQAAPRPGGVLCAQMNPEPVRPLRASAAPQHLWFFAAFVRQEKGPCAPGRLAKEPLQSK
jgi:hypothetical protein